MTSLDSINNDLDLLINEYIQENYNLKQEKEAKNKEFYFQNKELFFDWLGYEFDKERTVEYVEKLLFDNKYSSILSFYKGFRKNIKDNIKLLGYVLEEKGLSEYKSELWDEIPDTVVIGIKDGAEIEVTNFLLNDPIIKDYLEKNLEYNKKELFSISLEVPSFYIKLYQLILDKKISNSFYDKDNDTVLKLLSKADLDINGFEFKSRLNNKWENIYISLLNVIFRLYIQLRKINGIISFILENKALSSEYKDFFIRFREKIEKLLDKVLELKKDDAVNYYIQYMFNEYFERWEKESIYYYKGPPTISKTSATKIWNTFKKYLNEIEEIKNVVYSEEFNQLLEGVERYIITNKGTLQNFLEITNFKTNVKQMLLSGYFYQGEKLISEQGLNELVGVLIEGYSISDNFTNLSVGLEIISDRNSFIKEYSSKDELLPQRLIQKADSLIRTNEVIKKIDYYIINYLKTFLFEYIKRVDQDLYDRKDFTELLDSKNIISKTLFNKLLERYEVLVKAINNIEKNEFEDALSKKIIYTIKLVSGIELKLTLTFKKDLFIEFRKDLSSEDIALVRENLLYYLNNNFPELVDILKDKNLLITNFLKNKLSAEFFFETSYYIGDLGFNFTNENLNKLKYFYETLYNIEIPDLSHFTDGTIGIIDYIIYYLVLNDLIYIYKKKNLY